MLLGIFAAAAAGSFWLLLFCCCCYFALQAGRHLSTLEKIALAEFVVAGNVHKVKNTRDVIAAHRITGHTIVFPIDSLGCVTSRTMTLPRTDIAARHFVAVGLAAPNITTSQRPMDLFDSTFDSNRSIGR